jgi:hypothetical protein
MSEFADFSAPIPTEVRTTTTPDPEPFPMPTTFLVRVFVFDMSGEPVPNVTFEAFEKGKWGSMSPSIRTNASGEATITSVSEGDVLRGEKIRPVLPPGLSASPAESSFNIIGDPIIFTASPSSEEGGFAPGVDPVFEIKMAAPEKDNTLLIVVTLVAGLAFLLLKK